MTPPLELLLWTALSLACGTVGVNLFTRSSVASNGVLKEVLRFAWMVGIPFAALVRGASGRDLMALGSDTLGSESFLGFSATDWLVGTGATCAAVLAVCAVLGLAGRAAPDDPAHAAASTQRGVGLVALRDAPYNEIHWQFYRCAPLLWLGDPMLAVFVGFAPMAIEWFARPEFNGWLATLPGRRRLSVKMACALASGILFLATQNLWLMMLADLAIQLAGSRLVLGPRPASRAATAQP